MANAAKEWEEEYRGTAEAHRKQNTLITADFAKALKPSSQIYAALTDIKKVLEIGCGTGELAGWIAEEFGSDVTGIDLSRTAIALAQMNHGNSVDFWAGSFVNITDHFDLVVSSHVLEHFKDYESVLREWLEIAPLVLIIVPYKEPDFTGQYTEGGLRHRSGFDEKALSNFTVLDSFLFRSWGWQSGKDPRNFVALVKR